jgi:peptidoglycan/LPS O-acetylase OafA/YrhL
MRTGRSNRRLPSLEERFLPRSNGLGLIRLVLAFSVLLAHAWTLGFAWPGLGPLGTTTQGQANSLTVFGFFVVSGYLITSSGLSSRPERFAWHRFAWHRLLRIMPGYWVCLLVTALVAAPLVAWYEGVGIAALWAGPGGSLHYLWTNSFTSMDQFGIADLLADTPYGRIVGGSVFDGSLWSLKYELACYILVGVLAAVGVLRRSPWLVLGLTAIFYLTLVIGFLVATPELVRPQFPGAVGPIPPLGYFNVNQSVYLGFMFLLGACIRLYQHRLPMHGAFAFAALVLLVLSLSVGGYVVVGMPAYAYLLMYLAIATPAWLHVVGRHRDYSYGVYLYSFPVEQVVALFGGTRWGLLPYILLCAGITLGLAMLSWHLVERPAMRLKNRSIGWPRRRAPRDQAPATTTATNTPVMPCVLQRASHNP